MITDSLIPIQNPNHGTVVMYHPFLVPNAKRKKPYPVFITSGEWLSHGRISNFWYWKRVSPSGRIDKIEESGYGNFTQVTGCEVIIKVKVAK